MGIKTGKAQNTDHQVNPDSFVPNDQMAHGTDMPSTT
jgi:hypothetical protein